MLRAKMDITIKTLVVATLFAKIVTGNSVDYTVVSLPSSANLTGDAGILRSLITVYALPPDGGSIYVKLYSRDDSRSKTFTELGSLEYSFSAGAATKFWVDTVKVQGSSIQRIMSKPVFGDGVPSKSGTWWVDVNGMKRIAEDSDTCPDVCATYHSSWRS